MKLKTTFSILTILCLFSNLFAQTDYFIHPTLGTDDPAGGSFDQPFKTLKFALGKDSPVQPGDFVLLRGTREGAPTVYPEWYINVQVKGEPGKPVHIANFEDEQVVIDGQFPLDSFPHEWSLHHGPTGTYVIDIENEYLYQKFGFQNTSLYNFIARGNFRFGAQPYALIPYKSLDHLMAREERFSPTAPYYAGPGIFIEQREGAYSKLYVRLQAPDPRVVLGNIHTFSINGRQLRPDEVDLHVTINHVALPGIFLFRKTATVVHVEGLEFINIPGVVFNTPDNACLEYSTFRDLSCKGPGSLINFSAFYNPALDTLFHSQHNLVEDVEMDQFFPPWVAFGDLKSGLGIAQRLDQRGLNILDAAHHITIRNCHFRNMMDGMYIGATALHAFNNPDRPELANVRDQIVIVGNYFENLRDDGITLSWAARDIVIRSNRFLNVPLPISKQGGAGKKYALPDGETGLVFIHHNLMIQRPKFNSRQHLELNPRYGYNSYNFNGPAGNTHNSDHIGFSPWKIYHNTFVCKPQFGFISLKIGGGFVPGLLSPKSTYPPIDVPFDPDLCQEVYNNIFILEGDEVFMFWSNPLSGREIYDGNVYYRTENTRPFWRLGINNQDETLYPDLASFQSSRHYRLTQKYYSPGWESRGIETDDPLLKADYTPLGAGPATQKGIDLRSTGWDGTSFKMLYRGAFPPTRN